MNSEGSSRRADAVRNRAAILEAAKQLVTEQGTEVAMGEIARAAGVAVGTLYRHFPNKADLLAAVVSEYVESLADAAQGAWERVEEGQSDAAQELLDFLERALEMIARSHAAKAVAQALGAEVEYAEPETRATEALGRLIEQGRASRPHRLRPLRPHGLLPRRRLRRGPSALARAHPPRSAGARRVRRPPRWTGESLDE